MNLKESKKDLLHGALEMLILNVLTLGPRHGYGVAREIERTSEDFLFIEEGSLYPALHRMERKGWLASDWGRSENGRRAKYYRLTPVGRQQLETEREVWSGFSQAVAKIMGVGD